MIPTEIVIHHSGGQDGPEDNTAGIRRWHMGTPPNGPADGPYRDIAYNVLVEKIGDTYEAIMGRPWDWNGAHTLGHNEKSLGICLIGNFNLDPPPSEQLAMAAKIVAFWMRLYSIPVTEIYPHKALNQTSCPGDSFDMAALKAILV